MNNKTDQKQSLKGTSQDEKKESRLVRLNKALVNRFTDKSDSICLINHQTDRVYNVSIMPDGKKFQVIKTWGYVNLAKNCTAIECNLFTEAKALQKKLIADKQSIESPNPWIIHKEKI